MISKATFCFGLFTVSILSKSFAEVHSKKEQYFGAYIGEFQDRFHGISGQVKSNIFSNFLQKISDNCLHF